VSPLIPGGAEYRMFFVPRIPRNAMGKIDRPRLVETVNGLLRPAAAKKTVDA
jgi:acyl-coenzyme A synthetase/AMP-(fatty) acid ligase